MRLGLNFGEICCPSSKLEALLRLSACNEINLSTKVATVIDFEMDFASLMKSQINKSKPNAATNGTSTTQKFQRKADVEAERQRAYAEEQARLQAEREERVTKKRKLEENDAELAAAREVKLKKLAEENKIRREEQERDEERQRRKRLGLPELQEVTVDDGLAQLQDGEQDMPDDELRTKLRELDEPACLFDEDHSARLVRYHKLARRMLNPKLSKGPIPTTLEPLPGAELLIPDEIPNANSKESKQLYRQIGSYLTLILTEWSAALASRDEATKQSQTGKAAHNSFLVVLSDLTPLFRQLESQTLDPDLLPPLCEIIRFIQKRQYVKANDAYLRLSIGKAAWPIGVTMVGIHERSAREKLNEHGGAVKANIMSDEVTRKMLQSVKRCISFAQTRWPPDDLGQLMG